MKFTPTAPLEDIDDSFPIQPASAYSYFAKFIIDSYIENLYEKTNMYHLQMQEKDLRATSQEIKGSYWYAY